MGSLENDYVRIHRTVVHSLGYADLRVYILEKINSCYLKNVADLVPRTPKIIRRINYTIICLDN